MAFPATLSRTYIDMMVLEPSDLNDWQTYMVNHALCVEPTQTLTMVASTPVNNFALDPLIRVLHVVAAAGSDDLRGITGGTDGRRLEIWNTSSVNAVSLIHESASATAANRMAMGITGSPTDIQLGPYQHARARYFTALSRWVVSGPF